MARDYNQDLKINEDDLSAEWLEQPSLYSRIRELFDYHTNGYFICKKEEKNRHRKIGDKIGVPKSKRYTEISIDGKSYKVHRLIFLWHHGYMPENDIDHIDRDILNNRIENLREVSEQCNSRNSKTRCDNTSGIRGVYFNKPANKWIAYIYIKGVSFNLGSYEKFNDAVMARWKKEVELNWNGCDSSSPSFLYLKENKLLPKSKVKRIKWKETTKRI